MKRITYLMTLVMAILILVPACKGDSKKDKEPETFEEYIEAAWDAFADEDYDEAIEYFAEAIVLDNTVIDGYTGLGWSYLRDDQLDEGNQAFGDGALLNVLDADLFAGWAFLLNALKEYANSNLKANVALTANSEWQFENGFPLDVDDLYLLKADNFFMVGYFENSLVQVQMINPAFIIDFDSVEGQTELAAEIERLRAI